MSDYEKGFNEGYKKAVHDVRRNRDHFRRMINGVIPFETFSEAIDRIYNRPKTDPSGAESVVDGIDLYVVLPDLENDIFPSNNKNKGD